MARHPFANRPRPPNTTDLLAKALLELPPELFDNKKSTSAMVTTQAFDNWLSQQVNQTEDKLGHILISPLAWKTTEASQNSDSEAQIKQFFYYTRPKLQWVSSSFTEFREGALHTGNSKFDTMRISYVRENTIAICFRCNMSIEASIASRSTVANQLNQNISVGSYCFSQWSPWLKFPLEVFGCWIKGQTEDHEKRIELMYSDNLALQYRHGSPCPLAISRLFRDLGDKAFEHLAQIGCMEPETCEAITTRINRNVVGSIHRAIERTKEQQAGEPSKTPSSTADRIQALQMRRVDLERLQRISENSGIFLTTIPWMRLLKFRSQSGPSTFFARMEQLGLITTTKRANGVGVSASLTEKGARVLRASD